MLDGPIHLLDPDDAENLEYDDENESTDFTGVEVAMAGLGSGHFGTRNVEPVCSNNDNAVKIEEMRTAVNHLRGELDDVRVDLDCTKTMVTSLERQAEISTTVFSKKVAEVEALKKEVESLAITVRALSLTSRQNVFTVSATRKIRVSQPTQGVLTEENMFDDDDNRDLTGDCTERVEAPISPSVHVNPPEVEAVVDITCVDDHILSTENHSNNVRSSQGGDVSTDGHESRGIQKTGQGE